MAKVSKRPKPKSKKPAQKLASEAGDVYAVREATKREVGDVADKITRAPKRR